MRNLEKLFSKPLPSTRGGWTVRKDTIYIKPFQADNKAACERAEKQIRNLTQCSECRYE